MKITTDSVDYRRNESAVTPTPATVRTVYRVTYTVPLDSVAHEDFDTKSAACAHVMAMLRVIQVQHRGVLTISVLR